MAIGSFLDLYEADSAELPKIAITEQVTTTPLSGMDREEREMLAEQMDPGGTTGGTIQWLGSSYSGADIKVVAHLYKKEDTGTRRQAYEQNRQDAEDLVSFLNSMIGGGLEAFETFRAQIRGTLVDGEIAFDGLRTRWWKLAGISEAEASPAVYERILGYFTAMMLQREGGINQITITKHNMISELPEHEALVEYWTTRVQQLDEMDKVGTQTATIATLQTLAVQTHREKYGVRALGKSYVKGYTRGPRTIAGSMVFTIFNEHPLTRLIKAMDNSGLYGESILDTNISTLIPDQLPPIDLTIIFANEYGSFSRMSIYGVEFVNDSQTFSVEDIMTEGVMNFVARDVDIMTSVGMMRLSRLERGIHNVETGEALTGSELMITGKEQYEEYIKKLGIRRGFVGR